MWRQLTIIGKEIIRTEVEFVQAKLLVKQIVRQVAKCTSCGKKGSEQKTPTFVKAQVPKPDNRVDASVLNKRLDLIGGM